jgi:hypothetical protein
MRYSSLKGKEAVKYFTFKNKLAYNSRDVLIFYFYFFIII